MIIAALIAFVLAGAAMDVAWDAPMPAAFEQWNVPPSKPLAVPVAPFDKPAVLLPLQTSAVATGRSGLSTHSVGSARQARIACEIPSPMLFIKTVSGQA